MPRLQEIGPDIWLSEGAVVDFYGFPYSTRMLVVRLMDESLWVWSPIALDDELKTEIEALGIPAHLVSPNKLHHLYLQDWQKHWPEARLWGLPSVQAKRKDLAFAGTLSETPPPDWSDAIDQTVFTGSPFMDECVFFHKASRTAIFADLIENFSEHFLQTDPGWSGWKRWVARVWHITEPFGMAPLEWRLSFFNRTRARDALHKVIDWDAGQVVMAHGRWIDKDGANFIRQSFRWLQRPNAAGAHSH
ncbi:MAG: DUF4336 domain-containing protein [Hyphomicrobiaceae bacterium]|nr:DUF4336 domain-containing protein [Hyphomicrobiaceae bacterium]